MSRRAAAATFLTAALSSAFALTPAQADVGEDLREVMFVGNNWSGTASIVDARTRTMLKTGIDLIPDKDEELAAIMSDPTRLPLYLAIQQGPGEGHDQYVDDMFTTNDGKHLAVSRPSFGDVVWIDIAQAVAGKGDIVVREQDMDGFRTDHMAQSPDGRRLLVSDSTERQVIEYSMVDEKVGGKTLKMGDRLRTFESGETPHESNYTADASRIFHASIGRVYTPGESVTAGQVPIGPADDALKGDRWFQIVRNSDFAVTERWDMAKELAEAGHPNLSPAVRPMALAPDERFVYFQVSYFHGLVEFDTQAADLNGTVDYTSGDIPEPRRGAVTRVIPLENRVPDTPLELYVNDSAHHGLAIDDAGTTLCAAGTMDDYVAVVDRASGQASYFDQSTTGHSYGKPYWTVEGLDDTCWISLSEADSVAVLDLKTKKELAYFGVGDHPQRIRLGVVPASLFSATDAGGDDNGSGGNGAGTDGGTSNGTDGTDPDGTGTYVPGDPISQSSGGSRLPATGPAAGLTGAAGLLVVLSLLVGRRQRAAA